jgi:hypothetical protein
MSQPRVQAREVLFWRLSLATIGAILVGFVAPPILTGQPIFGDPPIAAWISVIVPAGAGFILGGVYGRFRGRRMIRKPLSKQSEPFWAVWTYVIAVVGVLFAVQGGMMLLALYQERVMQGMPASMMGPDTGTVGAQLLIFGVVMTVASLIADWKSR